MHKRKLLKVQPLPLLQLMQLQLKKSKPLRDHHMCPWCLLLLHLVMAGQGQFAHTSATAFLGGPSPGGQLVSGGKRKTKTGDTAAKKKEVKQAKQSKKRSKKKEENKNKNAFKNMTFAPS